VRAKLARALELLLQLDEHVGAYLDTEPVAMHQRLRSDGRTVEITLRVTQQPPVELSLLVGEVAHQLRSALDHVAYGLVQADGNTPTNRTAFPVLAARPLGGLHIPGGVAPAALAAIEELQPYQRLDPEHHPLHILNTLWNIDKHRHLHLTALQATDTQAFLGLPDGSALVGGQVRTLAVGDGDVFAVVRLAHGPVDPELELTASGRSFLALGDKGPWQIDLPVLLLLEQLHQYVALVALPRLEPLLISPAGRP